MSSNQSLTITTNNLSLQQILSAWEVEDTSKHIQHLARQAAFLKTAFQEIGDKAATLLETQHSSEPLWYKITFEWAEQTKGFLILWRDILFEQQKGLILHLDQQIEKTQLKQHQTVAKTITTEAFHALQNTLTENIVFSKMLDWQLQKNPWTVYREQIDQLSQQCQDIVNWGSTLKEGQQIYQQIYQLILETLQTCKADVETIERLLNTTIDFFKETTTVQNLQQLGKISSKVQELRNKIKVPDHRDTFVAQLNRLTDKLPIKLEIPVEIEHGLLVKRSINFQRDTQQWLESEITPQLYDVWEVTEGIINGMKMVLINMRNQVAVLSAQMKEEQNNGGSKIIVTHSLISFKNKVKVVKERLEEISQTIQERLLSEFKIAYVYDVNRTFLPTKFQSPLNSLPLGANNLPNWLKKWFNQQRDTIQQQLQALDYEKALSTSEKIVRFTQNRTGGDSYYADIFLTSGYVGESFWIGRTNKLKRAGTLVNNWKAGYRGSILLTGKRLSGKSLFGERIANLHFSGQTIRLFPDSTLFLNGRKLEISYDLHKALNLIKTYAIQHKTLIWIDNLELWWDINIPLNRNVRALKKFIDNNNRQLFFMVAMSDWLKAHLNAYHHLDRIFQAEIQMDKMSVTEIEQAIDIRHGATHKELIENNLAITTNQFKKAVKPIYTQAAGNIGESLLLWTAAIEQIDDSKVRYNFKSKQNLPEFLDTDMAILLTSIILQKRTNEYRLRKLFGPAFSETYIGIIKRLLGIGILQKRLDDWIEVNETIANPLADMLVHKKYLKVS